MRTWVWESLETPVGPVSVGCGPDGVGSVRYGPPRGALADGDDSRSGLARAARRQIAEFFRGDRRSFGLPLDWSCFVPAQLQVLRVLHEQVGYGETITYGTLADRAGVIPATADEIPARAVGQVMGTNPLPLMVPCHRVVASDGIGGYSGGGGIETKHWLLVLEGSLPPTLDWIPAAPDLA